MAIGDFYPQSQQATSSIIYARPSHADPTATPESQVSPFWRASLGASIDWELDFWGKFRRAIQSADAAYLASIASYDDTLVTLLGDVATTYIGIRTLQTQIAIAEDNIVKQKKALAIAEARFRGGAATKLDVYQAENVLGQTESAVPQLTAQLKQGMNALRVLLGMAPQPLDDLLRGPTTIPVPPINVAVGVPADLVRRRPDIRAAELAAMSQSAQIGFAEANLYPAFSLFGTFGTISANINGNKLSDLFMGKGITFGFGPTFQWNILNYGQITNTVRVQDAKLQELLVDYQNSVLTAQKQVENGLATFLESRKAGRRSAAQRRRRQRGGRAGHFAISAGHARFHDGADGGAEPLHGAERPRYRRRKCLDRTRRGLSGAGGRMADTRQQRVRTDADGRRDAQPHQLGRSVAAREPAAAAGAGSADAGQCQRQTPVAGMVRAT